MEFYSGIDTKSEVIFDACIFMLGVDARISNENYSLQNMQKLFLDCVLNSFEKILLHKIVYNELDSETKELVKRYVGKNIRIVNDDDLIGQDPEYTEILEKIQKHDLLYDTAISRKNKGEVYSLAYAAYYNIPFFSSNDANACDVCSEIDELSSVEVIGLEKLLAFAYQKVDNKEAHKGQKALYKEFCSNKIKRKVIPETLGEFLNSKKGSQ